MPGGSHRTARSRSHGPRLVQRARRVEIHPVARPEVLPEGRFFSGFFSCSGLAP